MIAYAALADLCDGKLGQRDVPCPECGPDRRSPANRKRLTLRVWHREPGFATYSCARCGERGFARERDGTPAPLTLEPAQINENLHRKADEHDHDYADRQLNKARRLWQHREPIAGSPAEIYLRRARGCRGEFPDTISFLPALKPEHHPALIAAFGIAGELEPGIIEINIEQVRGVHLTLLKADGSGKAGTDRDKIMLGASNGWPIVLAAPNDLLGLAITEGIEDALSVHQATGLGAWAAGSAGRMPALAERVPSYIETCTIYAHQDDAGRRGADQLADALLLRRVELRMEGIAR
ncbi:MAG: toprim domain-containing protein [Methyloceanibacter sp.]